MQLCSRTSTDYYRGKSIMLDNISIAIDCNMQLMEANIMRDPCKDVVIVGCLGIASRHNICENKSSIDRKH